MDLTPYIIYEDDDILAINKPAGIVVHPDGRTNEPSVSEWFALKYPDSKDVGEPIVMKNEKLQIRNTISRPGVVHRIDRETSGVLLLAKTKKGHICLKDQFKNREIKKVYHVFVTGEMKEDHGTINFPIGRSATNFRKWSAEIRSLASGDKKSATRGELREAVTYFQVLKRSQDKIATFVEAKPKTGRTHQIRVHFKAMHHPVIGDKLYGGERAVEAGEKLGFGRVALHAREIIFKNTDDESVHLTAEYPEDFQTAFKKVGL